MSVEGEEKVEECQNEPKFTSEGDFVFEGRSASAIKADVFMISGCLDSQCSYEIDEEIFSGSDWAERSGELQKVAGTAL